MGILDDAIREHLDLKRRHGAEDSELQRLEDEAFGLPTRPGEPDFPESEEQLAVGSEEATALLESDAPPPAPEAQVAAPEAPPVEAPAAEAPPPEAGSPDVDAPPLAEEPAVPPVAEPPLAEEPALPPVDEPPLAEEPPPPVEEPLPPVEEAPPAPELGPSDTEVDRAIYDQSQSSAELELDEGDLELELEEGEQSAAAEPVPFEPPSEELPVGPETVEHPMEEVLSDEAGIDEAELQEPVVEEREFAEEAPEAPATGEEDALELEEEGEGDVLEETPEFLRDQPEDDELWFEQGEPKDFDF